jgi:hypothetical protein
MSKKKHLTIDDLPELSRERANFVIEYCKDTDARRAAVASGLPADDGYKMRDEPDIATAIQRVLQSHLSPNDITPEWLLQEFYYNHLIARQRGNISASNQCLNLIAKHASVDAYAAEKVKMTTDQDTIDRLMRERKRRMSQIQIARGEEPTGDPKDCKPVSFL